MLIVEMAAGTNLFLTKARLFAAEKLDVPVQEKCLAMNAPLHPGLHSHHLRSAGRSLGV